MHYMDANKTAGEETRWQLHKNAACNPQKSWQQHPTRHQQPPAPYHEIYKLGEPDMQDIAGEAEMNS